MVDGAALTVHDEGVGIDALFYIGYVRQKVGESHVYTHNSLELLLVVEGLTDGDDETCKTRDKTTQWAQDTKTMSGFGWILVMMVSGLSDNIVKEKMLTLYLIIFNPTNS